MPQTTPTTSLATVSRLARRAATVCIAVIVLSLAAASCATDEPLPAAPPPAAEEPSETVASDESAEIVADDDRLDLAPATTFVADNSPVETADTSGDAEPDPETAPAEPPTAEPEQEPAEPEQEIAAPVTTIPEAPVTTVPLEQCPDGEHPDGSGGCHPDHDDVTTTAAPTSTQPPTSTAPTSTEPPTTTAPTTTKAPTTTQPPTTTEAPTTTQPPTTTEAPTTTQPPTTTEAPTPTTTEAPTPTTTEAPTPTTTEAPTPTTTEAPPPTTTEAPTPTTTEAPPVVEAPYSVGLPEGATPEGGHPPTPQIGMIPRELPYWDHPNCAADPPWTSSCYPPSEWEMPPDIEDCFTPSPDGRVCSARRPEETPRLTEDTVRWTSWCHNRLAPQLCTQMLFKMKWALDFLGAHPWCVLNEYAAKAEVYASPQQPPRNRHDLYGWHHCATVIDPVVGTPDPGRSNDAGLLLSHSGISLAEQCRRVLPPDVELEDSPRRVFDEVQRFDPGHAGCDAWAAWAANRLTNGAPDFRVCDRSARLAEEWMEHHYNIPEFYFPGSC